MEEIDVPGDFLCPISLQLMRDPVTVCTGITYDRENIEKWLFSCNNNTCPVTKQSLVADTHLTPNHTLRRLIQSWCTLQRIPSPKPPIDTTHITKLLSDAKTSPHKQLQCLTALRSLIASHQNQNQRTKHCLQSAGALHFLASTMKTSMQLENSTLALEVLFHLNLSQSQLKALMNNESVQLVESLHRVLSLGNGNYQSRAYATMLLKSAFEVADPIQLMSVKTELFVEVMRVLRDKISQQASKAALKLLVELCPWGRNRIKAVEGGAVWVLVELLLQGAERRACELVLIALDQLCGCAEGRAELLNHAAGLAVVSKKILRVSHVASDRGVRILGSVCRYLGTFRVLHEMLQVGAVSKLCLVLQVDTSFKTKERAKEILKLHSSVWKNSPCVPLSLLSSYP